MTEQELDGRIQIDDREQRIQALEKKILELEAALELLDLRYCFKCHIWSPLSCVNEDCHTICYNCGSHIG